MKLFHVIAFLAIAVALAFPQAQKPLTNSDIIEMAKAGFDEDTIIKAIEANKPSYDTSAQGLLALKNGGVSSKVIKAVLTAATPAKADAEAPKLVAPAASASTPSLPTEIGVYLKKEGQFVEVEPEIVNWKTGGVLKHVASAGIVKGDVNGRIIGNHSRNLLKTPLEFLIVAAEGVAITEYQLIHLHEQNNAREFRTVTGGVLHTSGGAVRDMLLFEGAKVASRSFVVKLPTLGSGEYGFLPPGAQGGSSTAGAANIGKMYTFRVGD